MNRMDVGFVRVISAVCDILGTSSGLVREDGEPVRPSFTFGFSGSTFSLKSRSEVRRSESGAFAATGASQGPPDDQPCDFAGTDDNAPMSGFPEDRDLCRLYNPESMLEHAICHLLRHRRQLERWSSA